MLLCWDGKGQFQSIDFPDKRQGELVELDKPSLKNVFWINSDNSGGAPLIRELDPWREFFHISRDFSSHLCFFHEDKLRAPEEA
jgi:hypothetical protein